MELIAVVASLALLEYFVFVFLTGSARSTHGVAAPAITGHPIFERYFRVQQNTLEQLIVFVPALFLFGRYVSAPIGAVLGLVFIIGRALYLRGYVRDPEKRGPGALITFLSNLALLLGGGIGAVVAYF